MAGIVAVVTGLLFGAGLAASGMTNPEKVQGFLDLTGVWDPSLMFVMGGAVVVTLISFRFILKLSRPVFSEQFHMPSSTSIDTRLIIGAALFGTGWGLVGYCPGPSLGGDCLSKLRRNDFFSGDVCWRIPWPGIAKASLMLNQKLAGLGTPTVL